VWCITNKKIEIMAIRKGLWEKVATRLHSPIKVFPFGDGLTDEVMLYGTVAFKLKDERRAEVSGTLSFALYYLYLSDVGFPGEV
jgi:hypothetical protein